MGETSLTIAYVNCVGQSGLPSTKQSQIEEFIARQKVDILNLQEIDTNSDSFQCCPLICSSFNIIPNNAPSKYGTATIVKSDMNVENLRLDSDGRMILFEVGNLTVGNLYLPSGTDAISRGAREKCISETLPQLMIHRGDSGVVGGDLNCIIDPKDATHHQAAKMSPSLAKLVRTYEMTDCFRNLHNSAPVFSHFYHTQQAGKGATRIDRSYFWGRMKVRSAKYEPVAFSDHMAHIITLDLPSHLARIVSPRARPLIKVRPEVIGDEVFQQNLYEAMEDWKLVRDRGLDTLKWWELVVKPGVKQLAMKRSKEINWERRGELNLLMLRQSYLARRLQCGELEKLGELKEVQKEIQAWWQAEGEKLVLQARTKEVNQGEQVRLYHHELHKKHMKKSAILRLQTESGLLEGHSACAEYLENQVRDLLLQQHPLDQAAMDTLLGEVEEVFSESDNNWLLATPIRIFPQSWW